MDEQELEREIAACEQEIADLMDRRDEFRDLLTALRKLQEGA